MIEMYAMQLQGESCKADIQVGEQVDVGFRVSKTITIVGDYDEIKDQVLQFSKKHQILANVYDRRTDRHVARILPGSGWEEL